MKSTVNLSQFKRPLAAVALCTQIFSLSSACASDSPAQEVLDDNPLILGHVISYFTPEEIIAGPNLVSKNWHHVSQSLLQAAHNKDVDDNCLTKPHHEPLTAEVFDGNPELLAYVMSFLAPHEVLAAPSAVSHKWHMTSEDIGLWENFSKSHRTLLLPKSFNIKIISRPNISTGDFITKFEAPAVYTKSSPKITILFESPRIISEREINSVALREHVCHITEPGLRSGAFEGLENNYELGVKIDVLSENEVIQHTIMSPRKILGIPAPHIDADLANQLHKAIKSQDSMGLLFDAAHPNEITQITDAQTGIIWTLNHNKSSVHTEIHAHNVTLDQHWAEIIDGMCDMRPTIMFTYNDAGAKYGLTAKIDLFALIYRGQLKNADE